jgi:polyisoprenyl-phosphate glycosyltransferase
MTLISLVVPTYNEEDNIDPFVKRILLILEAIDPRWEILFINDGSNDATLSKLNSWHQQEPRIKVISLARNFGKEAAATAGLDYCSGQVIIPIDVDLQDPPEIIPLMIAKWREGYKVVLATRKSRKSDSKLKRLTASFFYTLINKMAKPKIPKNTGDFRLIDRQVLTAICSLRERVRFMKGIYSWPGFKTTEIFFERSNRSTGKSKWNYWKLLHFALDGIFSFTTVPLQIWMYIGFFISSSSFIYAAFLILRALIYKIHVPGYASIMTSILFFGGVQLISLGVIGEYIGRIYQEAKRRPIYIVEEFIGIKKKVTMNVGEHEYEY